MDRDHRRRLEISPIFIGLVGIVAGAIIVAAYQLLVVSFCRSRGVGDPPRTRQRSGASEDRTSTGSNTNTSSNMARARVPATARYVKEYNEETCSVCLCDFNEGERIRVLPECMHLFHVDCIDTWLHSHPNCPLCRAGTLWPPPRVGSPVTPEDDSGGAQPQEIHHQVILVDDG